MQNNNFKRWSPVLVILGLLIALFFVKQCQSTEPEKEAKETSVRTTNRKEPAVKGLNRYPSKINYSRHARCRMECRKIDASEVEDILENGKINYAKSEIGDRPDCKKKYAVEGTTKDKQRVRIIFAPCKQDVTVVTVIDIGKEWPCDCP